MTDWRGPWLKFQIAMGEQAYGLRQAGTPWPEIALRLRLGDQHDARRCVGLFLQTCHETQYEGRSDARD